MSDYKAISLFSGAMGLDIGVERSGIQISVCVENNHLACNTIRKNSNVPVIERDINLVSTEEILKKAALGVGEAFLVVGGPPCQAFSTAGARRGMHDFRGNVIINYLRVIEQAKPKYFIMENVRGLLSSRLTTLPDELMEEYCGIEGLKGGILYYLVKEFEKVGYTISFSLFNSANYGTPQKRERLIIFGNRNAKRVPLPSPTHTEDGEHTGGRCWKTLKDAIASLDTHGLNYIQLREKHKKYMKQVDEGQYWKHLPENLQKEAMGKSYFLSGGRTGFFRRLAMDKPSPTLVTSPEMPATMLCHPYEDRPLSVEEYARIQEFPDSWKFAGNIREQYKQIGNAVPIGLGYMAGKAIVDFHEGRRPEIPEVENRVNYSRYKNCTDTEFLSNFERMLVQKRELFSKEGVGDAIKYA